MQYCLKEFTWYQDLLYQNICYIVWKKIQLVNQDIFSSKCNIQYCLKEFTLHIKIFLCQYIHYIVWKKSTWHIKILSHQNLVCNIVWNSSLDISRSFCIRIYIILCEKNPIGVSRYFCVFKNIFIIKYDTYS